MKALENLEIPVWDRVYSEECYQERYRNQFHFSPKSGWMNDINGLWYADGQYHMTYQADPDNLRAKVVQWGYATSPDMLHWTHHEPIIVPGKNSKGQAWSGTAVVDVQNSAGFGAGTYILFYTDIERGQCLIYSNDKGNAFHNYDQNPVVSLDNPAGDPTMEIKDQRDPKIYWDEDIGLWVMMVYRDKHRRGDESIRAMQFYTSSDLKHWTRQKDFYYEKFHECPDVFRLAVNGGSSCSKWVFQSASSYYCMGKFDGEQLLIEDYTGEQICYGPDIYAGQSFSNLPDGRTITMYWMDNWHGSTVPTTHWTHSATFPTTLELKSFPEGLRVVRNPVKEIEFLYKGEVQSRHNLVADAVRNPLSGLYAGCFDMTVTLDLASTKAEEILFDLMGKQFRYYVIDGTLSTLYADSRERTIKQYILRCLPSGNLLKMRFLVDMDSLEVFINDGRRSYTEEIGFSHVSKVLALHAEREVAVPEVQFHEICSIW